MKKLKCCIQFSGRAAFNRVKGFTLIELLVVIVIMIINGAGIEFYRLS